MEKNIFFSVDELCAYLGGVSKSFVYKLSHNNVLPKYCPGGKLVFFKRSEVDSWILKSRVSSVDDISLEIDLKTKFLTKRYKS